MQIIGRSEWSRGSNCIIMPNFVEVAQTVTKIWLFSIFQDGGRRHLGFLKFQICNGRNGQEGQTALLCQILSKSLEMRLRYGYFLFFQLAAVVILDFFSKFWFLLVKTVKRVELHHHAKFRRNRSNRSRDMAIFDFFEMAAVRRLGFVMRVSGPPTKGNWWSLSLCKIWLELMQ